MIVFFPAIIILMAFFTAKWHFYKHKSNADYDENQMKWRRRIGALFLMLASPFIVDLIEYLMK